MLDFFVNLCYNEKIECKINIIITLVLRNFTPVTEKSPKMSKNLQKRC